MRLFAGFFAFLSTASVVISLAVGAEGNANPSDGPNNPNADSTVTETSAKAPFIVHE